MAIPSPSQHPQRDGNARSASKARTRETVSINGESFELDLAVDNASRARGLGHRDSIDPRGGMLFIFPQPALQSFWMKHCTTDIDLIFLDADGRITALYEMPIEPPQQPGESELQYESRLPGYLSLRPAQFAIELAPGSISRLGLHVDDRVELDLLRLKALAR